MKQWIYLGIMCWILWVTWDFPAALIMRQLALFYITLLWNGFINYVLMLRQNYPVIFLFVVPIMFIWSLVD